MSALRYPSSLPWAISTVVSPPPAASVRPTSNTPSAPPRNARREGRSIILLRLFLLDDHGRGGPASAGPLSPAGSRFDLECAVQNLFAERDAFEFRELGVRLDVAVERQTDFPGSDEDLRVLDGRLVLQVIRCHRGVALHHVQRV